ncbi:response regulator [Rhodospirillaceae bacterium SYSU D60014]|uniref:response regulator n=1 Tax=Virgifigura deserti TaxID=2268457 RepID=UPI000E66E977
MKGTVAALPDHWSSAAPPRRFITTAEPDEPSHPKEGTSVETGSSKRQRILIVEDEALAALAARDLLHAAGYEVVGIAATAEKAVRKAEETRPDLVLMDIRLAGSSDGIAAAIDIRTRLDLPSLFVSAYSDPGVKTRAAAAHPAGFLAKPYRPEELLGAIRKALWSQKTS